MASTSYSYLSEPLEGWPAALPGAHHAAPAGDFSILHELNMVSERFDSPASSFDALPAISRKRRAEPVSLPAAAAAAAKRHCGAKAELLFATEPVTPSHASVLPPGAGAYFPTSPAAQSLCSEEDEAVAVPSAGAEPTSPAPTASLPTPSAAQAAKRRALRLAHLKRSRTKKETGAAAGGAGAPNSGARPGAKPEAELLAAMDQPDKKAARAIRNRAAAMKSRVEAKAKMQKLEDDNARLSKTVSDLTANNKLLAEQVKALTASLLPPGVDPARSADILALAAQLRSA